MNVSTNGIELIKQFEGCSLKGYKCPAGIWTIGYGHTNGVKEGQTITKEEAELLLKEDLAGFEKVINNVVNVEINQNQFDALVSFSYNIGIGALQTSTLLKLLNKSDYNGAAEQFNRWVYAKGKKLTGLVKRRSAEKELFLKPITTHYKVIAAGLNVRSGPGINYDRVNILYKNKIVEISKISSRWAKLSDGSGWVCLNYLKKV